MGSCSTVKAKEITNHEPVKIFANLECPICYVGFNEAQNVPKCLQCGHTICSNCISSLQVFNGTVQCPFDKKECSLKEIPTNFIIYSLKEGSLHTTIPKSEEKSSKVEDPTKITCPNKHELYFSCCNSGDLAYCYSCKNDCHSDYVLLCKDDSCGYYMCEKCLRMNMRKKGVNVDSHKCYNGHKLRGVIISAGKRCFLHGESSRVGYECLMLDCRYFICTKCVDNNFWGSDKVCSCGSETQWTGKELVCRFHQKAKKGGFVCKRGCNYFYCDECAGTRQS